MSLSIIGGLFVLALLAVGWLLGSPLIIGLYAALPFGTTAIGTLGGSTPLIAVAFELMLVALYLARLEYLKRLLALFARSGVAWVALALVIYVVAGAFIIPRLLAGQVPVVGEVGGYSTAVPIQPVAGNMNQSLHFGFGVAIFLIIRVVLADERNFRIVFRGLMLAAAVHLSLGLIDYTGKLAGINDVLAPIRTAGYVMHTNSTVGRFWRIAGGGSEASFFATEAITYFALTLTYWRATGSRLALGIALPLALLLVLSTSTTAYVALFVLALPMLATIFFDLSRDRLRRRDAAILGTLVFGAISIAVLNFAVPSLLSNFFDLLTDAVLNKSGSDSANERTFWNTNSMNAFYLTNGLGIGIGSSRASSWVIAVISQFGVIGTALLLVMIWVIASGVHRPSHLRSLMKPANQSVLQMADSVRAAAIAALVARSLVGGGADPGLIFMTAVAYILAANEYVAREDEGSRPEMPQPSLQPSPAQ